MMVENEKYPKSDWVYEVANGDTYLGYADWLVARLEQDLDEAAQQKYDAQTAEGQE